jgi:hypothetical protein
MAKIPEGNTTKADDPAQYQRFRDLAAELDAEGGDEKAVDRAVKRLGKAPRHPKPAKKASRKQ